MEIKVSVIMAVYNGEKYIRQALDTVTMQTLKEIEIICVDDGSVDGTMEILKEYEKKDSRIRILSHPEKTDGAAEARNMGMDAARGEYLSFLDADDFFEPDMLEKAYGRAKEAGAEVVVFDAFVYHENTKFAASEGWVLRRQEMPNLREFKPTECPKTLFRITLGAAWNALFSRKMVETNDIRFVSINHTDDQVFVYTAFAMANKIAVLPERLIYYRRNIPGSQSSNAHLHPEAGYMASYMLMQELKKRGIYEKYKIAVGQLALEIFLWHIERMTDVENFHKLYFAIQNRYMKQLGILELTENDIQDKRMLLWRDQIMSSTPEEYLLKWNAVRFAGADVDGEDKLPKLSVQAKVAIYGAGVIGFQLFNYLLNGHINKVVAWADQNYKKIGFPVQSPEVLKYTEFDHVLIAIRAKSVYREVKEYLMEIGIPENKIEWVPSL